MTIEEYKLTINLKRNLNVKFLWKVKIISPITLTALVYDLPTNYNTSY